MIETKMRDFSGMLAFAIVLGCVLSAGCGKGAKAVDNERTLRVAVLRVSPDISSQHLKRVGIGEKLVEMGFDMSPPSPQLSTEWDYQGNGAWRFRLRQGVKFHDGSLMTADIVKSSLEFTFKRQSQHSCFTAATVTTEDQQTVIIKTDLKGSPVPEYMSQFMILHPDSFDSGGRMVNPIGTGPFKVESVEFGARMTLVANPDYWGGRPAIGRIEVIEVKSALTRVLMIENGDVDWIQTLPCQTAKELAGKGFGVHRSRFLYNMFVRFNCGRPPFDDVRLRKAVSHLIDRQAVVDSVFEGFAEASDVFFPEVLPFTRSASARYQLDRGRAESLIEEAGFAKNKSGIYEKDGKPLSIRFTALGTWPILPLSAEVIQQQMRDAGIKCEIFILEEGAWTDNQRRGDYDISILGRVPGWNGHPLGIAVADWHSKAPENQGYYHGHYRNAEVDRLIDAAQEEEDAAKRDELIRKLIRVWSEDAALAMICHDWSRESYATSPNIENVSSGYSTVYAFPGPETRWK